MATRLYIKPQPDGVTGIVSVRIRKRTPAIDIDLSTKQELPCKQWTAYNEKSLSSQAETAFRNKFRPQLEILATIEGRLTSALEQASESKGFGDIARKIIFEVVNATAIEENRKAREERERLEREEEEIRMAQEAVRQENSFMEYYEKFVKDAEAGLIKKLGKGAGSALSDRTIINYRQGYRWLKEYQDSRLGGRGISFDDINRQFFDDYQTYLEERILVRGKDKGTKGCSQNTISMRIAELKTMMRRAYEVDEVTTNDIYRNKSIKVDDVEVDAIALTRNEIAAMNTVDISDLPKCYETARDIFMVGVWTAQRVSDYNGITTDDIKQVEYDTIITDDSGRKTVKTVEIPYISIRQRKTGKKVQIPVTPELQTILDKYNNDLPHIYEQKINEYIKVIARRAGLTGRVLVTSMKGGKAQRQYKEKWEMVHTHTARRTGATIMYNEGCDIYDIMKITGHSNLETLKRYIKANDENTVIRIYANNAYFQR